jgi:outer membrane protein TolC
VADSLRAVSADASTLQAQTEAEAQARETLQLTEKRFRLGAVSQLALLDAQRTWQQARISLISASASRHADSAALFLALGGGWWNRNTNPATPISPPRPVPERGPLTTRNLEIKRKAI